MLRSTPAFFVTDDHYNFENDELDNGVSTMPPDSYGPAAVVRGDFHASSAGQVTQRRADARQPCPHRHRRQAGRG